jgi:hypothetical protein
MEKRRAESRKGMMVTTVALSVDTRKRLAVAAVEEGAAMTELVRRAVEEWLRRRKGRIT